MRFFAAINSDNIVRRVVTAGDDDNIPGCKLANGEVAWVECKRDGSIRTNWPDVGSVYKPTEDVFCGLKPYPSWVKHIASATWKSPIGDQPDLSDEKKSQNEAGTHRWSYNWNEDGQSWDLVDSMA